LKALIDRKNVDATGALLALLTSVFWGANTVAIKLGLADAPPLRLAWMRFVVGGAAIAIWAWATGRLAGLRIAREEWRPMLVLALIFTAQIGSMNIGTSLTSATHAAILLNLYSVHTVVLSHFLIPGDRLTVRRVAGVAIAYTGIVVLFAGQAGGGAASLLGDAIVFVSAFLLAERLVYLARAVQKLDPVKLLLSQAAVGCALFMLGSALTETMPTAWTSRLVGSIAYQGVLIAGFNFVVNLWLLQRYRPSSLVPFFLTQPLFGVVAAALLTGDPLTWELLLAGLAVAIGMGLSTR
jgi:drug/metabolite transporter (DMT)-like permease